MNILIDSNILFLKEVLEKDFNVMTFDGGALNPEYIRQSNSEILFVRSTTKCDVFLLGNTKVNFIGTATAGVDNLDIEFLEKNEITWVNAAGSNSISVAEYVTLSIQLWCLENLKDISDMTLGIVGYGNIGSKVGKIFEKHCKKILVFDPYISETKNINSNLCDYDELLKKSDIITFHTPLVKEGEHPTYKMLNLNMMELINKDALLINASRGGVVDEYALKVNNYNPKNLIFDVFENEPNIDSLFAKNLFISSPHIAGHSIEGKLRGTLNMVQGLEIYLGKRIDKSIIMNELDKVPKVNINNVSYNGLFSRLKERIGLEETSINFKRILNNYEYSKFNKQRKEYPKHNETLSDESF